MGIQATLAGCVPAEPASVLADTCLSAKRLPDLRPESISFVLFLRPHRGCAGPVRACGPRGVDVRATGFEHILRRSFVKCRPPHISIVETPKTFTVFFTFQLNRCAATGLQERRRGGCPWSCRGWPRLHQVTYRPSRWDALVAPRKLLPPFALIHLRKRSETSFWLLERFG